MMIPSLLRRWFGAQPPAARPGPRSCRPRLEMLEDRRLLSAVLLVDDDGAQNPSAPFTTISAAVAAASPGDKIRVYAGTYNESVDVPITLDIEAVRGGGPVVVDPGASGPGFNVHADK